MHNSAKHKRIDLNLHYHNIRYIGEGRERTRNDQIISDILGGELVTKAHGVLRISSDGDDRRIFLGLKFSISGFFGGRKIWQVFFWSGLI